jgi:hypothetical protein
MAAMPLKAAEKVAPYNMVFNRFHNTNTAESCRMKLYKSIKRWVINRFGTKKTHSIIEA